MHRLGKGWQGGNLKTLRVSGHFAYELGVDLGGRILILSASVPRCLLEDAAHRLARPRLAATAGTDRTANAIRALDVFVDQLRDLGAAADDEGHTGVRGRVLGAHSRSFANSGGLDIEDPAAPKGKEGYV